MVNLNRWVFFIKMTTAHATKILEVKDLKTHFYTDDGEVRANDGLSYHVNKMESVGIVGESA